LAKIIGTIPEPNKTIDVVRECDVVVVGDGTVAGAIKNASQANPANHYRQIIPI
jgi:hypothetical protein